MYTFLSIFFAYSAIFWHVEATIRSIQVSGTLECCQDDSTTVSTPRVTEGRFIPITTTTSWPTVGTNVSSSSNSSVSNATDETQILGSRAGVEEIRAKRYIAKRNVGCEPVSGAILELWERDPLPFDDDDLINKQTVGADGKFDIRGSEDETGAVVFFVKILHTCGIISTPSMNSTCKKVSGMEYRLDGDTTNKIVSNVVWNLNQATPFDEAEEEC